MNTDNTNISIVMPVYNAEQFLERSISSVLRQTYENWELLCVDDGSTDNSYKKLLEFAEKDRRIKVFQQKNQGIAKARAFLINEASGDYTFLLDADDWCDEQLLENAVNVIKKTNADIVLPNMIQENIDNTTSDSFLRANLKTSDILTGQEAFVRSITWNGVNGRLFCKTPLSKKAYCDNKNHFSSSNSDEYITRLQYINAKIVAMCSSKYYYMFNSESNTKKHSAKTYGDLQTNQKIVELAKNYAQPTSIITFIELNSLREMIDLQLIYFKNSKKLTKKERKFVKNEFQTYYKKLNKENLIFLLNKKGITQKIQIFTLLKNYNLFKTTLFFVYLSNFISNNIYIKLYNKFYPNLSWELLNLLDEKK
ncbi:MAG: glycosyltransferase family 2 protein [Prevotellaceae bacterium]|jgi:glycosyltransferase involved in cell wall biosynthesis|nr:glycosyltransferase family 2 protein [Prevotellaceae bacterium]